MDFKLTKNIKSHKPTLKTVVKEDDIILEANCLINHWQNPNGSRFYLLGEVIGFRKGDGLYNENIDFRKLESKEEIKNFEGRFLIINILQNGEINLWNDYFGRYDVYWRHSKQERSICISSNFNSICNYDNFEIDQTALAQVLSLYGGRPLKKHSLDKNIKRLGVKEKLKYQINVEQETEIS